MPYNDLWLNNGYIQKKHVKSEAPFLHLRQIHHQRRMMEQEDQQQQQSSELVETSEEFHDGVNMDAMEILHVKKNKALQKKSTTTTTTPTSTSFRSMQ